MAQGLYVHIPFCDSICAYCDFARVLNDGKLVDEYLMILSEDIKKQRLRSIKSIYIGGGTPSALTVTQLQTLFEMLKPYTGNLVEYTIEINPESLTKEKAELMKHYGINRASLGMQVTQNNLLKIIDRKHSIKDVEVAIDLLRNVGISNISIDLMYGIPSQTLNDLNESLRIVSNFGITHISLYALTIEPHSKFNRLGYTEASSELDASMYEMAVDFLEDKGFKRYEISNFSKEGFESFHNKVYWHYEDFIGVGLHASGKENHIRYTNTRNLQKYLNRENPQEMVELSLEDEAFEYVMMNLRLTEGFSLSTYKRMFQDDFLVKYDVAIKKLVTNNMLSIEGDRIKATSKGLELLFNVLEEFME